jgi:DNA modification methylase
LSRVTIHQGHVLEVLKGMEAESVHCVVTSPPYWSLRDYGIEPQVWGGEAGCQHE